MSDELKIDESIVPILIKACYALHKDIKDSGDTATRIAMEVSVQNTQMKITANLTSNAVLVTVEIDGIPLGSYYPSIFSEN